MRTDVPGPQEAYRAIDLALRAGEVLLSGGAGAADVTATCTAVAEACGLRGLECDLTFTSISVSWQPALDVAPLTGLRLVQVRGLDYTRVTAVHNLVHDLVDGRIDQATAAERLREVVAARHPYRRPVVTGARAMLATSVAVLLGAGPVVAGAAFAATVAVDLVGTRLHRRGVPVFYQNVVGGLIATAVALGLVAAGVGVRPSLVVAGGIVLLLPGVTLVGAVQDAITGFYVTASARAFETFLLTAGIISGVALALSAGNQLGLSVHVGDIPIRGLQEVPLQLLAAAVVSASFAVANYAPRRTVPAVGAAGALGWATFVLVDRLQLPATFATAVAAVLIGLGAGRFARRQKAPVLVYLAGGIIPLLPGLLIYRGMRRFADGDSLAGITLLGEAVSVGLALAAGAILGEFLGQPVRRDVRRRDRRTAGPRLAGPRGRRRRA
ncbi:MAG TPA: threonine/serine exporter family protein [Mycobacteriales bacterium]|nr:threonine/serine exporter family protein [Mycobacteriales bacterium]